MWHKILLSFIPIFVAIDVIGILPLYSCLTNGMDKKDRTKILFQSLLTALCLAVGFIFVGKAIFKFLGITINDFMIAGGGILFCLGLVDIINPVKKRRIPGDDLGAVPLGTPLIVGPAVLTTSLLVISQYGMVATLISVLANIMVVGLVLAMSDVLNKILGDAGSKALSKITSLLLAAIAVMMIRKGVIGIIQSMN